MGIKFVPLVYAVKDEATNAWKQDVVMNVNPAHVTTVTAVAVTDHEKPITFVNILGTPGYFIWGAATDIVNKLA